MESVKDESELFVLPAQAFVPARNELATRLAAAGKTAESKRVRSLRKPNRVAAAVNRAVRAAPKEVRALFDAVDTLQEASRLALAGKGAGELRAAQRVERAALDGLVARISADLGSGEPLAKARSTLLALSRSGEEGRASLLAGMLSSEVAADPLSGAPLPRTVRKRAPAAKPPSAKTLARDRRAEERRRAKAARALEAAEKRARAARRAAELAEERARSLRESAGEPHAQ